MTERDKLEEAVRGAVDRIATVRFGATDILLYGSVVMGGRIAVLLWASHRDLTPDDVRDVRRELQMPDGAYTLASATVGEHVAYRLAPA